MSEEMLDGIVAVPKEEAGLLLEAGYLLMELGKPKEAAEVFAGVAALLPSSDVARVAQGNLEFSQGRFPKALKFHQEALKVRPDSGLAQAHIGEVLLFQGKKADGVAALKKSLELEAEGAHVSFAEALLEAVEKGELG
jgi:tetratricopeptide (TPR) repeat protein